MSDRENVIRHFQDAISASGDGNHWRFVRADIIEDAITLLKEQEPVKPQTVLHTGNREEPTIQALICGNCHKMIVFNYCPWCGRKVKWNA